MKAGQPWWKKNHTLLPKMPKRYENLPAPVKEKPYLIAQNAQKV